MNVRKVGFYLCCLRGSIQNSYISILVFGLLSSQNCKGNGIDIYGIGGNLVGGLIGTYYLDHCRLPQKRLLESRCVDW